MTRLMWEFGLTQRGWTFRWMNRKATLGLCKYGPMELLLSRSFVDLNTDDTVDQVCRHEIAHALAGHEAAHGPEWVGMAYQCGVRNPSSRSDEAVVAHGRYQATCPTCTKLYSMHRRPKVRQGMIRYCPPCWAAGARLSRADRAAAAGLTFTDTRVTVAPRTPARAPLAASQSTPSVSVSSAAASAPKERVSAPELAAAMGVEAKQLRAWLRRHPDLQWEFQDRSTGAYSFDAQGVRTVVRLWNDSH